MSDLIRREDALNAVNAYCATEYHRRNMQVARVCGAQASVERALERALSIKSIPNWMIAYLESAAQRLPGLQHDLAAWRDLAPDAPEHFRALTAVQPDADSFADLIADARLEAAKAHPASLRITGPNSDGEYWLHIKSNGSSCGVNLGTEHGPICKRLLDVASETGAALKGETP